MSVIAIKVDASFVQALYFVLSYIATVAIHIEHTWVENDGALVVEREYASGDIHVLEYQYIADIKVMYTYVDENFRHVRCYDGDKVVYSGSVYKGIPSGEVKPIITKKMVDLYGFIEMDIEVWTSGCVIHSCPVFEKLYNPFKPRGDTSID